MAWMTDETLAELDQINPGLGALARFAKEHPNIGLDQPSAIVLNPEHALAGRLKDVAPKVYNALERSPDSIRFERVPKLKEVLGYVHPGRGKTTIRIGNDVQSPGLLDETLIHEGLHALYRSKYNKMFGADKMWYEPPSEAIYFGHAPVEHGRRIYNVLAKKLGWDPAYADKVWADVYQGDAGHAALETMTDQTMRGLGLVQQLRELGYGLPIPPQGR